MFGDRHPSNQAPPFRAADRPAAAHRRSARRVQAIVLAIALIAVFAMAAGVSLLWRDNGPRETSVAVTREEEREAGGEPAESETPDASFNRQESFVGDGSTFVFRLAETPSAPAGGVPIKVLVNGANVDAKLRERTVTFDEPPADGDEIRISYVVNEEEAEVPPELPRPPSPETPAEPEEPEAPVLIVKEVPPVPAHPDPPIIDINRPPPDETSVTPPEPPDDEDIDRLYPDIDQDIKDLAAELSLANSAKKLLYDHDPQIFEDPGDPGYICGTGQPETIIYGCWKVEGDRREIHLIRSPSIHTTLTHELLHAIYYEAVLRGETDELHELLDEFRQANPGEVAEFLEFYQHHYTDDPEWNRFLEYSEIHSFVGSQFRNLPAELEAHYEKHFEDRGRVVGFYEAWDSSAQAKSEENGRIQEIYDLQLAQWQACLEDGLGSQACRSYRPEGQAYQDYNACLISYKTTMSECLAIKPPEVSYQPAQTN